MKSLLSPKSLLVAAIAMMVWISTGIAQQTPAPEPGPLPEGEGKAVIEKVCATMCHDHTNITRAKRTKKEWEETIAWMQSEQGAVVSEEEYKVILTYVTTHFLKE